MAEQVESTYHLINAENKYKPAKAYVTKPIDVSSLDHQYARADIEFYDVDHSEASYTAHLFFNNPKANDKTARNAKNGYAGCFHVFGHGGCYGDAGHCDVPPVRRLYDPRPAHPLTKATKVVIATNAVRQAVGTGGLVTLTVVPLVTAATNLCNIDEVFSCSAIRFVAYR